MASRSPSLGSRYRWKEFGLLMIPFVVLIIGMIQLLLVKLTADTGRTGTFTTKSLPPLEGLIPILGLIALLFGINFLFSLFFRKADQVLLPLVGLLSGIGVLMATRLGPSVGDNALGTKQLLWVLLGLVVCVATISLLRELHWLERYKYTAALFGLALVCTTLVNTLHIKNFNSPTHDQLNLGPFAFQPSELLKICIVIFFAAYLSENREVLAGSGIRVAFLRIPPLRLLGPIVLMLGISLLFFLVVRELGLALLIYGIFLSMMYLGSGKLSYVISWLVIFALLGLVGYKLFPYIQQRFQALGFDVLHWQTWNQADIDFEQGSGNQIVQGLIALSSGGILGAGLGLGHPGYVPVAQSDMVLASLGEELGLAGLFAIIGIYLLIVYRGFRIAIEARDSFSQLLAAGLTSIFAIQTLIIAAGNMKLLPLTGIPLPFLSYGGSSIIANYIIVGILMRISYNTAREREGFF